MSHIERSPAFRWFFALTIAALVVTAMLQPGAAVSAQDDGRVTIFPPDATRFPEISVLLEPYNRAGRLITDLDTTQLTIIENGEQRTIQALERLEPGLQIILALNIAPIWATRTAGITHFEQIMLAIKAWAQTTPENSPDDFSLATNTGLNIIRSGDRDQWIAAIEAYQPELMQMEASSVSLSQALDLATDTNPRPNMKRAILYVTAVPNQSMLNALPDLTARARQLGVRVFVWLVGPENLADTPGAGGLKTLATESGGGYFHFTGVKALPDPAEHFLSLRYLYRVVYRSGVAESGIQRVQVELDRPDAKTTSREQIFTLQILPPNPIFLSPPSIINRQRQQTADRRDPPRLTPEIAIIPYLVEFPDGYARELSAARLYVDGALAVEKTSGPFEHFQWLLTNYEESGSHVLQVEVEDELGLVARSIETIVQVEVEPIRLSLFDRFLATGWAPVFAGIGLAGVILILALVIAGRKTAHAVHNQPKIRRKDDPLVQEVAIRQDQPARGRRVVHKAQPATVPRPPDYAQAPAFLVRISESGHPLPSSRIALARKETTFGSDPQQAITVLESPSVDALHARLYYTPEQGYMLVDAGSVAGTWVNFAPVSGAGVRLEHGDLVHIGRIGFRFELSQPQTVRQAIVVPYREE